MKKNIVEGYIYNTLYQLIIILAPLIVTPHITKALGITNYGIYSFVSSIFIYIVMIQSFGINIYGQREIAYYKDDNEKISKKFIQLISIKFLLLIIINLLYYLFIILFNLKYEIYLQLFFISSLANFFDITWFFQGIGNFKKIAIRNIIIKIIYIIFIFSFINTKNDLIIYFIIILISDLVSSLSLWPSLLRRIKPKKEYFLDTKIKKIFKTLLLIFILQISISIYTVLNKTMLGILSTNISETGYYELATKIIGSITTLIISVSSVIAPVIANNFYKKNTKNIKKYINISFEIIFLIGIPISIGICLAAKDFIYLFLGSNYNKVIYLIYILSFTIIPIGITNLIGSQYLISIKKEKYMLFSIIIGAICNIAINILLIPRIGALGAAISSVITEFIILIIEFFITKNDLDYKKYFKYFVSYFLYSLLLVLPFILLCKFKTSWLLLFMKISIAIIIYLIILIKRKKDLILFFKSSKKLVGDL